MEGPRNYLDHAATTPVRAEVREEMVHFHSERLGSSGSQYEEDRTAREALEAAPESFARSLGAMDFRIAITGGGTEADISAVLGALPGPADTEAPAQDLHAVSCHGEHPAVQKGPELARRLEFSVILVEADGAGRVDPHDAARALPGT